jgi:hypothetical protein
VAKSGDLVAVDLDGPLRRRRPLAELQPPLDVRRAPDDLHLGSILQTRDQFYKQMILTWDRFYKQMVSTWDQFYQQMILTWDLFYKLGINFTNGRF